MFTKKPIKTRLAIDLGTTTLAGYLLNDENQVLARNSVPNPQKALGLDVINRLEAAHKGQGQILQNLLADGIRHLVAVLTDAAGTRTESITTAAAAGNSAIIALLRGAGAAALLFPPHRLPAEGGTTIPLSELDLGLPVPLFLFPLAGGFVGGDLVSFLYHQAPEQAPAIYLDIGTNAELALWNGERWLVTSVAAGPAFEAADITWGMAATNGAIAEVNVTDDRLHIKTIGKVPPRGICGSGIAEIIAAALQSGLLEPNGTIRPPESVETNLARHIKEGPEGRRLSLYRDAETEIFLSQGDIRNFQLAKGAIRAGIECLMAKAALQAGDIRRTYLTGAFGLSLRREVLKTVAVLPPKMLDNVVFVDDGALEGVRRWLFAPDGDAEVHNLAKVLTPFPLSGTPAFEKAFLRALDF
jgi:uncharacterized 2Fe-2S/4Fe-4S cluster protein (DUF4445 family)